MSLLVDDESLVNEWTHTLERKVMDLEALVRALLARDDRRVADQRIVNARVRHQVGLELVQVDVESTVEAKAGRDGAHYLGDQTVEVLVIRTRNVEVTAADVVDGLVVDEECAVRVLDRAMRRENCVVRLDDRGRYAWGRVD